MAFKFTFPDVGEGIHEGTIVKWHVQEGDEVKEDATLVEMETAKAVVEIPSPKSGFILKRTGNEGGTVKVGDVLVVIGEKGEKVDEEKKSTTASAQRERAASEGSGSAGSEPSEPYQKKAVGVVGSLEEAKEGVTIQALPAVRRLAIKLGVDLASLKGTGPGGRITKEDVEKAGKQHIASVQRGAEDSAGRPRSGPDSAALPKKHASSPREISGAASVHARRSSSAKRDSAALPKRRKYDLFGYVERVAFSGIRKTIAEHMVRSRAAIPEVTHCDQCDVTDLVAIREKEKKKAEKDGVKLTYLPFIVKATVLALQKHPMLNATLDDESGEIILKKYYNIGIAVDTEHGLMVPVIKGADQKTILRLAREIQTLAQKAHEKKLDPMDMKGGSFTITNVGSLGGTYFTPVINFPEVAILGVAKISEQPAVYKGKVAPRHILNLCVTFDHRIIDGADAARFLNTIMSHLSDPDLLLVEAC